MIRKAFYSFFLLLNSTFLLAQNLVPNNGFDTYSMCPSSSSQIITPPWFVPTGQTGTPDYMNACFVNGAQGVPSNFYGYQAPVSPNGYYGMITYYGGGVEVREYLTAQLTSPLVAGQTYQVGFSVSLSDNFKYATDHYGAYLSATAPTWNGTYTAMNTYTAQIDNGAGNVITDTTGWTLVSGTFTAAGGEQYITIGNFFNDASSTIVNVNPGGLMWAYYYMDEAFVIPTNPVLQVSGDTLLCIGESTTLTVTGGGPYQWADASNQSAIISTDSFLTVTPNATTTYMVWNATDTVTVTVHVSNPPVFSLGNDTTICPGSFVILDATTANASYLWQNNSMNATYNANATGLYWCQITVNGCSATDSITVTVGPAVTPPLLSSNSPICSGDDLNLTSSFGAGATISWSGPNSFSSTQQNPTITGATASNAGNYTATVTLNGCTSAASNTNVVINQAPSTPVAGSNSPVCEGGDILLTASSTAGATYTWTGPNTWSSNVQNPTINNSVPNQSGNYDVYATLNGCVSPTSTVAVVVVPGTALTMSVTPVDICSGEQTTVTLTSAAITGAVYNLTSTPGIITGGMGAGPWTVRYNTDGTFNIILGGTIGNCVIIPDTATINVHPIPTLNFSPDMTSYCDSAIVNFSNLSSDIGSVIWNFGDGSSDTATISPTHTYYPGSYDVTLTVTSVFGCTATEIIPAAVVVAPPPVAMFTATPTWGDSIEMKNANIYFTNQSQNATSYSWNFGDGNTETFESGYHQYTDTGSYSVTLYAMNIQGCVDSVTMGPWVIMPDIMYFIPNAFTPNEDGTNDLFKIYGSGIKRAELTVFDRWGEKIFSSDKLENGWDGTYQGMKLNTGVFVYYAKLTLNDGRELLLKGDVSLLR